MEKLIEMAKKGDKAAFTKLILNIQNDLYRIGKARLNDDNDISDAIQETMIKAYNNIKKLKDNSTFKSWIIKILINECNGIYKKKQTKKNLIEKVIIDSTTSYKKDIIQDTNSKIDFELLIQNLSYDERLIITLFYNSKCSSTEISEILNMNINTVKSKINRTKEKIKKNYIGGKKGEQRV